MPTGHKGSFQELENFVLDTLNPDCLILISPVDTAVDFFQLNRLFLDVPAWVRPTRVWESKFMIETISRTDVFSILCGTNIYFFYSTEVWFITYTKF